MDNNEVAQAKYIEGMKRKILATMLSGEAFERLGRVRAVNPVAAGQAELYLIQIYQTGKLKRKVTDSEMKKILMAVSERKEFRIKRK